MKTLVLAGYRPSSPHVLGANELSDRIRRLKALNHDVVVVLSGAQADDQLRACPELADCELIFDEIKNVTMLSNVQASLSALNEACFLYPVEVPWPGDQVWTFLHNELVKVGFRTKNAFLQAATTEGAPWQMGFPILLTNAGQEQIESISDLSGLTDARLPFLRLPLPVASLASADPTI